IGIGAVIGAGIFSLTGTAAAGQTFASGLETPVINFIQAWFSGTGVMLGRAGAGPAIAVSFIVAGIACAFAAFCYAELASMIPVSGSAYTYSYATMGEIVAWVIGWDLCPCSWDSRKRVHEHNDCDHQDCRCCVRDCVWGIHGEPDELASVYAAWFPWPDERRGNCLLRLHRLRRRFDDRRRNAQPE